MFANFNRIHVDRPLNADDEMLREGLSILDEELARYALPLGQLTIR